METPQAAPEIATVSERGVAATAGPFVWPPRPPPPELAGAKEQPGSGKTGAGEVQRPVAVQPNLADAPVSVGRVRSLVREIEETWLGIAARSFAPRAELEGWRPDGPSAYCGRCGISVGPHAADPAGAGGGPSCPVCRDARLPWDRLVRLGPYEGLLRDAVHDLKFTAWRRVGRELGRALGAQLLSGLERAGVERDSVVIVPVPTTFQRRMSRGIDHTLVLARAVRSATGLSIVRALSRAHRPSQLEVPPSRREANVAGSMRPRAWSKLRGRTIVVLDDVVTTGATMKAACRALRAHVRRLYGQKEGRSAVAIWAACVGVARRPADPEGPI